jgi:CBS domain-containing protein
MISEMAKTPVGEVTQRKVVRGRATERLGVLVERMRELKRGNVLVEDDDGKLVGIFTERDLLRRVDLDASDWREQAVGDVMTAEPKTVLQTHSIATAMRRMEEGGFRHLPVIDASGRAQGVVSIRDLLRHLVEFFPQEFINLPPDPQLEAKEPWGG